MPGRTLKATPGDGSRLGATVHEDGVNFAVVSGVADEVTLCLFDAATGEETQVTLNDYDAGVWHGFVHGIETGQRYGYRVTGPFDPSSGIRCNPNKLLLDPYARAFAGNITWGTELLGHDPDDPGKPNPKDSKDHISRSVVTDTSYDWADDAKPETSYADTVVYEAHVKGFTRTHPGLPENVRGTYAGLAHETTIDYLRRLGVTAIELLPVHEFMPEGHLVDRGLTNYWGYNSIGFFAPHQGYCATPYPWREFKDMVRALHKAGIEVILDVVYNHTAEGNENGPTLSFRGLDNPAYYRLVDSDKSKYYDTTGTGNSFNGGSTVALRLLMDSLRYWLTEMHVDGFRFDLATTLAREDGGFDQYASFFDLIAQDPVVSAAKLIAEPWDVGQMDSYDLGQFPAQWREWNGKYRDYMRDFWRSENVGVAEFATRFAGSSDLYAGNAGSRRKPTSSVNLITVHDGFTLRDLVSYDSKHNEANGEDNRDGASDNRSWNCGAEGPADDPDVNALRSRQQRAMLTTLMLSFGLPLLLGGDEISRTQQGNNNAYCQDNEISWFDWPRADEDLLGYVRNLIAFRRAHPVFRRRKFLTGAESGELAWYCPDGTPMTDGQWPDPMAHSLAVYLDGSDDPDEADDGTPLLDDDFLVMVNAWWEGVDFTIPGLRPGQRWHAEIDTYDPSVPSAAGALAAGQRLTVRPRSLVVLKSPKPLSITSMVTPLRAHAAPRLTPVTRRACVG
jgi:isoamylase